jgi:hypothetical protein
MDKVLGRGRGDAVLEQVLRARVLMLPRPSAERGPLGGKMTRGFRITIRAA